eukprot:4837129-Amphidinium_carterae.1
MTFLFCARRNIIDTSAAHVGRIVSTDDRDVRLFLHACTEWHSYGGWYGGQCLDSMVVVEGSS